MEAVKEKDERLKALHDLMDACIKIEYFDGALEVAKSGVSKKTLETLIKSLIEAGITDYAKRVAKLAGRKLTKGEIDKLVKRATQRSLLQEALAAAKLGASKEVIESLIRASLKCGWVYLARAAAKLVGREPSEEEINPALKKFIKNKQLTDALRIAEIGGSKQLIERLIKALVEDGETIAAKNAAQLIDRKLSEKEINALIESSVKRGCVVLAEEAARLRKRGLTEEEVVSLVGVCIEKRSFPLGALLVKFGKLRKVADLIVMVYCKRGEINEARTSAKRFELSQKTLDFLVRLTSDKDEYIFLDTLETASRGASKETIEGLISARIIKGDFVGAQKAAKLARRDLTPHEIKGLAKYIERE